MPTSPRAAPASPPPSTARPRVASLSQRPSRHPFSPGGRPAPARAESSRPARAGAPATGEFRTPTEVRLPALIDILTRDASVGVLCDALRTGKRAVATGAVGSSTGLLAGAVARVIARPVVLVCAHIDDADEIIDELADQGVPTLRFPAMEASPGETAAAAEQLAARLLAVRALVDMTIAAGGADVAAADAGAQSTRPAPGVPPVIIAPIHALMQSAPLPARLDALLRVVERGQDVGLSALVRWLADAGYTRVESVEEPGHFALRGGILDIFPPGAGAGAALAAAEAKPGGSASGGSLSAPSSGAVPVRLDFFGDTVDRIAEIDLETMGVDRALDRVHLVCADPKKALSDEGVCPPLELVPRSAVVLLAETMEIVEQARGYFERVLDSRGISGPPAVLKACETRFHALAEINQFSAGASATDARVVLPVRPLPAFGRELATAVGEALALAPRLELLCQTDADVSRCRDLLREHAPAAGFDGADGDTRAAAGAAQGASGAPAAPRTNNVGVSRAYVHRGFVWGDEGAPDSVALVPYHELLGRFTARRRATRLRGGKATDTFLDFQTGDYVVHEDEGIARFAGLTMMKPRLLPGRPDTGEQEECLVLEFAQKARLYVPATQIDKVQRYVGGFAGKPPLSALGGQRWKTQKERAADSVRDLAAELLRVRAAREHMPGIRYPDDTPWQREFEAQFPYQETDDQLSSLAAIKRDMQSARPMDRLVCGDVGFGKTELAIRAAFKACEFGKQVAILVPTTVLAEQHERTFRSRFAGYPFRIESISRFKTGREANQILAALRKGQVDVIIGTHRLLSQDVRFADLGLVVIDEEQRFGVEHKERLLQLRMTVDVLTLSATPIPRTLHMAMLGIRDISSLTTPPVDRRAIVTEVIPFNAARVRQAIARELSRDGQVFYIHNRVHDILSAADSVRALAPEGVKIVIGHGQMEPDELEEVMLTFMRGPAREGGADILVSTTIVENGIDIPTANTMIIDDADRFGLAELHQLRGRVGRGKHRGYCYLLLPEDRPVKEVAVKRLRAIEEYAMLGAGFKIAMRDLEIRGAGNILGAEQSGHIAAVGYDLYCKLLEQAARDLRNEPKRATGSSLALEIGVVGHIPRAYIPSDARRLEAYRRIATAATLDELAKFREDLTGAYGAPPRPAQRLVDLAELRVALAGLGVDSAVIRERDVIFRTRTPRPVADLLSAPPPAPKTGAAPGATPGARPHPRPRPAPADTTRAMGASVRTLAPPAPDQPAEVYFRPPAQGLEPDTLLAVLRTRFVRALGPGAGAATGPAPGVTAASAAGSPPPLGVPPAKASAPPAAVAPPARRPRPPSR